MKPVVINKDLTQNLKKLLRNMEKKQVLVGIPAENAGRAEIDGKPSKLNNAEIGYVQETGAPERNLPARPFLVPGVAKIEDNVASTMKTGAKKALDQVSQGKAPSLDETLNRVGLIAQNAVRSEMNDGDFEPLAEATLVARRRRGRTGTKPLIDTGARRNSIPYVIRNGRQRDN